LGCFIRIGAAAAANLQHALTAPKLQRFKHGGPADDHVMALGQGALQASHVICEG
jgi:hypothetical protein